MNPSILFVTRIEFYGFQRHVHYFRILWNLYCPLVYEIGQLRKVSQFEEVLVCELAVFDLLHFLLEQFLLVLALFEKEPWAVLNRLTKLTSGKLPNVPFVLSVFEQWGLDLHLHYLLLSLLVREGCILLLKGVLELSLHIIKFSGELADILVVWAIIRPPPKLLYYSIFLVGAEALRMKWGFEASIVVVATKLCSSTLHIRELLIETLILL